MSSASSASTPNPSSGDMKVETDEVGLKGAEEGRGLFGIGGVEQLGKPRPFQDPPKQLDIGRFVVHQENPGLLLLVSRPVKSLPVRRHAVRRRIPGWCRR